MIIMIPRENHHARIYTAYRATQLYYYYTSKGEQCELVDLNFANNYFPTNEKIYVVIEWLGILVEEKFQKYISELSSYNEITLVGRYVQFYHDYARLHFGNVSVCNDENQWLLHVPDEPIFMKNAGTYAYAPIESSFGCFGDCLFCSNRIFGKFEKYDRKWRPMDHDKVLNYISKAKQNYNPLVFSFIDNNFIGQRDHALLLSKELIDGDYNIRYCIETRADCIDEEIINTLKSSGLRKVLVGFESGSEAFLSKFRKGVSVSQNSEAISILKKCKINIDPQIILFYPDAKIEEIGETLDFIEQHQLYNYIANGGAFVIKMKVFNDHNPASVYDYKYGDSSVGKFEDALRKGNIRSIRGYEDFAEVKRIYNSVKENN